MTEVAGWTETLGKPRHFSDQINSFKLNENFLGRIYALLVSRDGSHSHQTRSSIPKMKPTSFTNDGAFFSTSSFSVQKYAPELANLTFPESRRSKMDADSVDRVDKQGTNLDRNDSERGVGWVASDSDFHSSAATNGSKYDHRKNDQRSEIVTMQSSSRSSSKVGSQRSKKSTSSRKTTLSLCKVPTEAESLERKSERPKNFHVPGSYRSEIDRTDSQRLQTSSPNENVSSIVERSGKSSRQSSSEKAAEGNQMNQTVVGTNAYQHQNSIADPQATLRRESAQTTPQIRSAVLTGPLANHSAGVTDSKLNVRQGEAPNDSESMLQSLLRKRYTTEDTLPTPKCEDNKPPLNHKSSTSAYSEGIDGSETRDGKIIQGSTTFGLSQSPSSNASSVIVRRLSTISKAASNSSARSLHSGLQTAYSPLPGFRNGNEASHDRYSLQNSSSLPSIDVVRGSQEDSDCVNLIEKTDKSDLSTPKKHWVRQLLPMRSSSLLAPSQSNIKEGHSDQIAHATGTRDGKPSNDYFKGGATNKQKDQPLSNTADEEANLDGRQQRGEPLTRLIYSIETLLKEALLVAKGGKTVDTNDHARQRDNPGSNGNNSTRPKIIKRFSESSDSAETCSSCSGGPDEEDHFTSIPLSWIDQIDNPVMNSESKGRKNTQPSGLTDNQEAGPNAENVRLSTLKAQKESVAAQMPGNPTDEAVKYTQVSNIHDWAASKSNQKSLNRDFAMEKQLPLPHTPISTPASPQNHPDDAMRADGSFSTAAFDGISHQSPVTYRGPQIQPRASSLGLRSQPNQKANPVANKPRPRDQVSNDGLLDSDYPSEARQTLANRPQRASSFSPSIDRTFEGQSRSLRGSGNQRRDSTAQDQTSLRKAFSLRGRRHLSIRETQGFSLSHSHRRAPIARDWSTSRKRYVAAIACLNTALMGLIIGIYAGEVPAIQYTIVDEHHYTILGNVVFFIGLGISTVLFWPLPLLHGRKPYTLAALALLLPLLFPQAVAVSRPRTPYVATYRVALLLPRAVAGIVMGFANINFKTTLLDLFGASLQSRNPHQETVNSNDVRRHGGGMGVWLGIWTWCSIGSIGLGFLIGAVVISGLDVSWGFWLSIILTASALILNVLVPETRRSAYRRSMAEVRRGRDVSRRVARGEIKMHLDSTGPINWWEEVVAGHRLCVRMIRQPGFAVLALYMGWIYGQVVMVIVVSISPYHDFLNAHSF